MHHATVSSDQAARRVRERSQDHRHTTRQRTRDCRTAYISLSDEYTEGRSHPRSKRRLQQTSTPSWRHTCYHTGSVILVHKSWAQDCSLFLWKFPVPSFGSFLYDFMRVNAGYGNTTHHSIRFRCTGDEPSRKHIFYAMKAPFFPCRVIVSALFSSRGGAQLIGKRFLVLVLARWHYQARVDQCQLHIRTQYKKIVFAGVSE